MKFSFRRYFLVVWSVTAAQAAFAATITVNSTLDVIDNDDGFCTLREAITAANLNLASGGVAGECAGGEGPPTVDSIVFNIPGGGTQTITVAGSQLPSVTQPVTIDGANSGVAGNRVQLSGGGSFESGLSVEFTTSVTVRNLVVNGFTGRQLLFFSVTNFVAEGNYLGLNPAGDATVTGSGAGIETTGFTTTTGVIGGTTAAQRNVISSPSGTPILLNSASVTIQGNYIGLNAAGTARVGNVFTAVQVSNSTATIGGAAAGARNVIVGNNGIVFGGNPAGPQASGSVQGNYVGTDASGTVALNLNNDAGVNIRHGSNVVITNNVISGNGVGVEISSGGSGSSLTNTVQGNRIGTAADGVTALGNTRGGIRLSSSDNNEVGGASAGDGNLIAFNGQAGVHVNGGTMNTILGNSIHSNGGRGIVLNDSATPLANDAGDADAGSNNQQNYPVIDTAAIDGGNIVVSGALNSLANTTFRLEFFASPACDPSGNGEGRSFLGSTERTTNGSGDASFSGVTLPLSGGQAITATATLKTSTPAFTDTSEFSACKLVGTLDIDGNGAYDALTDGLLLIRHLYGLTGPSLTANAIGEGAARMTPQQIADYIQSVLPAFDIDLNTQFDALTDGLLAIRYLFGFRGQSLIMNAVGDNAQRDTVPEIESYILSLMP